MGGRQMNARSGQLCTIESSQSTPLPVELGLVVLDVPELQHALVGSGVVVGVTMAFDRSTR